MSVKDQVQDLLNNAQYQNALAFCMLTDSPKEDIQLIEERCVHFNSQIAPWVMYATILDLGALTHFTRMGN